MNTKGDFMMENNGRCPDCSALMKNLSEAGFYVTDLNLYLDTHPDDEKALCMFKEACKQLKICVEAFESRCYPLTACSSDCDCSWEWLCGAWPPEKL